MRLLISLALLLPLSAFARDWQVLAMKSGLTFKGTYQNEGFDGQFKRFQATIAYDAADLSKSKFDVTVDLASVDTGSSERDDTLATADFFDTSKTPRRISSPSRSRRTAMSSRRKASSRSATRPSR